MNIVLLQNTFSDQDIKDLISEFPQFLFLAPTEFHMNKLSSEDWERVEIIFGNHLSVENFEKAVQLKWIHSPVPNLSPLCLSHLKKRQSILVTASKEENSYQIGEYVMCGILSFAKNVFHWLKADQNPSLLWTSKWRDSMWTLKNKLFIQLGLGIEGTEIARRAQQMGMNVWGVQEKKTFHPYCRKIFNLSNLDEILPDADIVCLALPRLKKKEILLGKQQFKKMKKDSIIIVVGSKPLIDEDALANEQNSEKFRGILIDASYETPLPSSSKLWNLPNTLITPEVSPRPKTSYQESFRLFRYNLRQYVHGNFSDMRNPVDPAKSAFTL